MRRPFSRRPPWYDPGVALERRVFWVVLYALAMAAVEAAVVVDLRELYCPAGFRFPILDFTGDPAVRRIGLVEVLREAATMLMLAAVAVLAGRTRWQRWALFLLSFGLWDLFYYAWLKVFLGWPASLMTWDLLFLIPVPWTGPVLAPCLVALALSGAAAALLRWEARDLGSFIRPIDWALEVLAGFTVVLAFTANAGACLVCTEAENARCDVRFPGVPPGMIPAWPWSVGCSGSCSMPWPWRPSRRPRSST